MNKYRTHKCSELEEKDSGKEVQISGWLHRKRDHGNLLFILISILPVLSSRFSVPFSRFTTIPIIVTTDSGFKFSKSLKFLLSFSITHCVIPK